MRAGPPLHSQINRGGGAGRTPGLPAPRAVAGAQVYSQRWPQPAGQWELVSSHFMMCWRWPPWLQPWHQTKSPFTTW